MMRMHDALKSITLFIALFLFTLWQADGFAAGDSKKKVIDIQKGKEIYHERCAVCHGMDGNAMLPNAPSFAKGERLDKTDKELLQTIRHGKDVMPAWKETLTEKEMQEILQYTRVVVGDNVFQEKCLKCHGGAFPKLRTDIPDTKALTNFEGQLDICKSCEIEREMSKEELIEVIRYLRTLGK